MKRLTGRRDGRAYIVGCPDFALPKIAGLIIQQAVDRLAAIEDILGEEYDLDRLRELAQADREGRCVVIRPNLVTDDNYKIICKTINAEDIHLRKMRNVHEKHK